MEIPKYLSKPDETQQLQVITCAQCSLTMLRYLQNGKRCLSVGNVNELPYLKKGSSEVHLLFHNPGNQVENPEVFEQARRDTTASSDHMCTVFLDDAEIPTKWQEMLKCRKCK